jgi:excisionase family DNA binding protein
MPKTTIRNLKLLSLRAASRLLGLDHRTLRKAIIAGDCPAVQLGKRYKIERRALERWTSGRPKRVIYISPNPATTLKEQETNAPA